MVPRGAKLGQEASKRLQAGPKRRPRGSKLSPRGVQELQVEPKKGPRSAQEDPRGAQESPKSAKLTPKGAHERPSWRRRGSKLPSKNAWTAKKPEPRILTTLPHFLKVWSALEGQLEGKLELILAVQRASWSSEGHLGAQIGCTGHKEATKRLPVAPKRLQS